MADLPRKRQNIDMTEGPIAKQLLLFAIPLLLGDILQMLYNVVDSMIVGNFVSKQALAAVSATSNIVNIFIGMFSGVSIGATVVISKNFGAKRHETLRLSVRTTMWLTLVLGVSFTILGTLFAPVALRIMKTPDDVLADASLYLKIYFAGIAGQVIYNMTAGVLRAVGDSRRPMYVLGLTSILNIGLDILFIRTFGMGVDGAALATIIAQFISAGVLMKFLYGTEVFKPLELHKPAFDGDIIRQIVKVGIPVGIRKTMISFSNTIVISYINIYGSGAMAAWGVYTKVDQIVNLTIQSMSNAVTTFVAQNYGAGKLERTKKGTWVALLMTMAAAGLYVVLFVSGRRMVVGMFNDDADVLFYGSQVFLLMMPLQLMNVVTHTCCGVLQGRGTSTGPMYIMLSCYVLIRQIYLHVGYPIAQSFTFVISSYPATWFICMILTLMYTKYKLGKLEAERI
ncbi:MAG: MATE family efflux transporter [Firmicutes bacterium]|nr:MATE family efflux transporter [Bacillota bacterium]